MAGGGALRHNLQFQQMWRRARGDVQVKVKRVEGQTRGWWVFETELRGAQVSYRHRDHEPSSYDAEALALCVMFEIE